MANSLFKSLTLVLLSFCYFQSSAQSPDSVALSEEYYNQGMEVYNFESQTVAKDLFVLAAQTNPGNAKANLMAGITIMKTVHKEEALPYFMIAWKDDPKIDEDILYWIGQAYHYSEKFDSAIFFYEHYNKRLARSLKFQKSLKMNEVNRKIFECRNAKIFESYPVDVTITNLSERINTEYPEYAPTVSADGKVMVFTSRRSYENTNPKLAEDLQYYEDIYISEFKDGQWQMAQNIGEPLNKMYHDASVNISPDGNEMFIYSDRNNGDIYETFKQEDGTWSPPTPLRGEVNTSYIENSASITADNTKLFFISDRPGGYGGTDIWMATRNNSGAFINPVNLGPLVNSEFDEEACVISVSEEHLYFSSIGHAGMGDMDIYRSSYVDSTQSWSEPLNLGYPINSVENDIYFTLTGDEKTAFYSSVKTSSKGEQDIYMIDMSRWKPVDLTQPALVDAWFEQEERDEIGVISPGGQIPEGISSEVDLEIKVVDESSLETLEATVSIFSEDNHVVEPQTKEPGIYGFVFTNDKYSKYKVRITREGYLPHISYVYVLGGKQRRHEIKETIAIQQARTFYSGIINVYFGLDQDTPYSFDDIEYMKLLMDKNPNITIEISGHTDSSGPDEYNLDLSERRAQNVKKYLVDAGADEERIIAKGYGETKPIADNDTKQSRRLNRRVEFQILGQ